VLSLASLGWVMKTGTRKIVKSTFQTYNAGKFTISPNFLSSFSFLVEKKASSKKKVRFFAYKYARARFS